MAIGMVESLAAWAADMGTGCVGSVMDVVRHGDVAGMAILGLEGFCSSNTALVVLISEGGMGWVGSCTNDKAGLGLAGAWGGCWGWRMMLETVTPPGMMGVGLGVVDTTVA